MSEELEHLLARAGALRQAGQYAEAEAAYAKVLAIAPELADSWYNLAWLQRRLGRPHDALASYQRALDQGVAEPEEVLLNRAVILTDDLHQHDAAERALREALARNPAYAPALLNLANLHEDRGRRADAAELYERVLAADPRHWTALARLANVRTFASADDALIVRMKTALAEPGLAAADKAELGFALGRALDASGAYDQAFAAWAEANTQSRASAASPPRYDRDAAEQTIDAIMQTFPLAAEAAEDWRAPIFICGMFRSGSTLIEQVLGAHPRVTAGGELAFLPALAQRALAPFPQAAAQADAGKLTAMAQAYRAAAEQAFPAADVLTDKRPDNFVYVGLIKALFPRAKIIRTVRHPLDNCVSVFGLHLAHSMAYALDLEDIAHFCLQERRLGAYWEKVFGADLFTFDYDAFVQAPRATLEPLLAFCGLDWDEACLSFHAQESSVKTASVWQVRQPLYQHARGRWRNYAAQLAKARAMLKHVTPPGEG